MDLEVTGRFNKCEIKEYRKKKKKKKNVLESNLKDKLKANKRHASFIYNIRT